MLTKQSIPRVSPTCVKDSSVSNLHRKTSSISVESSYLEWTAAIERHKTAACFQHL